MSLPQDIHDTQTVNKNPKPSNGAPPSTPKIKFASLSTREIYRQIGLFFISFASFFFGQLCELCAPFFLVAGAVWLSIPWVTNQILHLTNATDIQTHNAIVATSGMIPSHASIGGHNISGGELIFIGIVLMLIASLCAASNTLVGRNPK